MRDLLDFSSQGSYLKEDRWLRFALRLALVALVWGGVIIVLFAMVRLLIR